MKTAELYLNIGRIVVDRGAMGSQGVAGLRSAIARDLTQRLGAGGATGSGLAGSGLAGRIGGAVVASVEPRLPKGMKS